MKNPVPALLGSKRSMGAPSIGLWRHRPWVAPNGKHLKRGATLLLLAALTGCATTRYVAIGCITQSQYDQLAAAKPGKIHSQLNGQADHDEKLIAGRLIRVEAWGDGELTVLGGCITKDAR